MNHDFWLFRQGEHAYTDYHELFARHDAPVSIDNEILPNNSQEFTPNFQYLQRIPYVALCDVVRIVEQGVNMAEIR